MSDKQQLFGRTDGRRFRRYDEPVMSSDGPLPAPSEPGGGDASFSTGAVRSADANGTRFDLLSPIALLAIARTYHEGATKYGDTNWERGMPVSDLLNHALRHIVMFQAGDRSEPHLPHAAWGLMAAIHSDTLWPHLNGNLRGPGCSLTPEGLKIQASGDAERKAKRASGEFDNLGDWQVTDIPEIKTILGQRAVVTARSEEAQAKLDETIAEELKPVEPDWLSPPENDRLDDLAEHVRKAESPPKGEPIWDSADRVREALENLLRAANGKREPGTIRDLGIIEPVVRNWLGNWGDPDAGVPDLSQDATVDCDPSFLEALDQPQPPKRWNTLPAKQTLFEADLHEEEIPF